MKLRQQGAFLNTMRDEPENDLAVQDGAGSRTFSNFNSSKKGVPENLELCDDLEAMRREIHKLRTESRLMAQKLKKETESRNRWETISRQKEQDMAEKAKELDCAKEALEKERLDHKKT